MKTEYHAFVDGDAGPCGAILRHLEPGRLRTRTVFKMGDEAPVYLVDHVVEHDGDVRRWTRFAYDSPTSKTQHSGTRDADGVVHLDGFPAPHLSDAVGGYGEHLMLAQMLAEGAESLSYLQFDEGAPDERPEAAELQRQGLETTALLDGSTMDAERFQVVLGGRTTNAHWTVDGVIVKSDWCGAESFLIDDVDALCEGLDPDVTARITEFVRR